MMDAVEANTRGLGAARGLIIALPVALLMWALIIGMIVWIF